MQTPHEIATLEQQAGRLSPSQIISRAGDAEPAAASITDDALELSAVVWHAFSAMFPSRWLPQVGVWSPDSHAVRTWASLLQGVSPRQAKRAFDAMKARGDAYPPSATEFRHLALQDGVCGREEAYDEAIAATRRWKEHRWTHPAVYVAAKRVGWYNLKHLPQHEARRSFFDAFADALRRLRGGEQLTCPEPLALPPPPEKPRDPKIAEAALQEALAIAGPRRDASPSLPGCARCSGTGVAPMERPDGSIAMRPCMDCFMAGALAETP